MDPIVERASCSVVVLKGCGGNREFKRVLVPLAGGPNGAFALEVAGVLAEQDAGHIVAFTVVCGKERFNLKAFVNANQDRIHTPPDRIEIKAVQADNVVDAILEEAKNNYDLVVLGCTCEPLIYQVAYQTIAETIARRCPKAIVMLKQATGMRSWIRRWF